MVCNRLQRSRMTYNSKKDTRLSSKKSDSKLVDLIHRSIQNTGLNLYKVPCSVYWISKICIICFLGTYALQFIALVMAKDDSKRLFECFSVMSFCGIGILKLVSLRYSKKQWKFLLNQVSKLEKEEINKHEHSVAIEYESDDEDNIVIFKKQIENYTAKFNSTSSVLSKIYWFTAVIFVLSPFVEYFLKRSRGFHEIDLPHVLPAWSPLDQLNFSGYLITVTCEIVAAIYCVFVHIAFDLTAFGIMTFASGQYSLLRDYSELIGGKGMKFNISKKRDTRAHYRIKKCHRIHIILNRSISTLDTLLTSMLGIYFFVAALTLCSVALRLKTETISIMQLLSLLQYMCATLTQLFLYCNYGNSVMYESYILTTYLSSYQRYGFPGYPTVFQFITVFVMIFILLVESDNLFYSFKFLFHVHSFQDDHVSPTFASSIGIGQGPFCAAYWCLSPKIRRELLLLGIGMMQTRRLHAGPFNSLDLPSFVQRIFHVAYIPFMLVKITNDYQQIVRAAYSYYAVLT